MDPVRKGTVTVVVKLWKVVSVARVFTGNSRSHNPEKVASLFKMSALFSFVQTHLSDSTDIK
ncbi:hypothetical protein F2Q70_00028744 [Brassica cretica]|uniref:Uncharacterized protein n=1 Tax=Brassica cretica TaxID=69181 RepID=A0A8S9IJ03_BRACR|nr:hypothetical protein F2Q68_00028280 [Brassica cretica]KAF2604132.1 hypothetical protein F2Q70_00028744 [Brassica cretica]